MEEIDLTDLLKYFLRKWYLLFLILTITVGLGIFYYFGIKTPMYKSSTTLVLAMANNSSSQTGEVLDDSITQNDIILNQKLVGTYREIIKSKKVLKQVIYNLDLDLTSDELKDLITVNSIDNTEIIQIEVKSKSSLEAKNIANSIANIFSEEIVDIYNIKNVKIIDAAEEAMHEYNMNFTKEVTIYVLIGLVIGFGTIFIMYYFDTTIKSVEEVERKLEVPILGRVPISNLNRKKNK